MAEKESLPEGYRYAKQDGVDVIVGPHEPVTVKPRKLKCNYEYRDGSKCDRELISDQVTVICTGTNATHFRKMDCGCIYDAFTEKVVQACDNPDHTKGMTVLGMHGHELITDFGSEFESRFEHAPTLMVEAGGS